MWAEKVMGGDEEQDQGFQEDVVMANKIDRVEEDARQFENQVYENKQDYSFHNTAQFINPTIKSCLYSDAYR